MIKKEISLWEVDAEYICVTTNGITDKNGDLVMGAGVALQAKKRFPGLPKILGEYIKKYGNRTFIIVGLGIISLPTKHHWKDKSDLKLIQKSINELIQIADKYQLETIALPPPGCGNGGLTWYEVEPILRVLDDRFIVCKRMVSH